MSYVAACWQLNVEEFEEPIIKNRKDVRACFLSPVIYDWEHQNFFVT